jgi:hypothetical protein
MFFLSDQFISLPIVALKVGGDTDGQGQEQQAA